MRSLGQTKRKILAFVLANPNCKIADMRAALPEIETLTLQTALTQLRRFGYITGGRNCYSIHESHMQSAEMLVTVPGSPIRELIRRHVAESPEPVKSRDIADEMALQVATIQDHLRALINEGKVVRIRDGQSVVYALPSEDETAQAA